SQGNPTWAAILFLCLQLMLVALGAYLVLAVFTKLFRRANKSLLASTSNLVWLVAAGLVLLAGPVQLFTSGLPVPIASLPPKASVFEGESPVVSESARSARQLGREQAARIRNLQSEIVTGPSIPPVLRPEALSYNAPGQPELATAGSVEDSTATAALDSAPLEETTSRVNENSFSISPFVIFGCVYMLPLLWLLLRVVFSTARLRSVVRQGEQISIEDAQIAGQAAGQLQLVEVPRVIYADVSVPMVCGLRKQSVLVPREFSDWSGSEKRAVLLHEFAHVLRRDAWGELLALAIQAMYWFHPGSWFVAHKLRATRELATDERVVASGMSGGQYARDLVSVLERLSLATPRPKHLVAVAMSDFSSVEERLSYILRAEDSGASGSVRRRLFVLSSAVGVLLMVFTVGAIRLTPVAAQESSPAASKPDLPANLVRWFDRFEQCEVREVSQEDTGFVLDLEGKLLRSDGSPAAGAIVVIRESNRAGHEFIKSGRRYTQEEKQKVRLQDVIAKVVADQNGRFRFEQVKAPYAPPYFTEEWGWDIVAYDS
ncbi:MAG: M56 family metallopeptidase, partial [Planctomycetota bacterium]